MTTTLYSVLFSLVVVANLVDFLRFPNLPDPLIVVKVFGHLSVQLYTVIDEAMI